MAVAIKNDDQSWAKFKIQNSNLNFWHKKSGFN